MKKLLFSLVSLACLAQAGTLGLQCPANGNAGATVTCNIVLAGGSTPADLQWKVTTSPALNVTQVAGTQGTAAGKTLSTNTSGMAVLAGINSNTISDGIVATVTTTLPATGVVTFSLSNTLGASVIAAAVVETANPSVSVSVIVPASPCDINGDGQTNAADVNLEIQRVLSGTGDINSSGAGDVVDIRIIEVAVSSGSCVIG